jgi:hypothetical protein
MPILMTAISIALVVVRIQADLAHAPWLGWSRALYAVGVGLAAVGGIGLILVPVAAFQGDIRLSLLLLVLSAPLWVGPQRIVEALLSGGPRRRFTYLALWERALLHAESPGREPPEWWHLQERLKELEEWADPATRVYAGLLADRTREWRSGEPGSPVERMRREIKLGSWMRPDVVDPLATTRWRMYVTYWVCVADAGMPARRSALVSALETFRDETTGLFIDVVTESLAKPIMMWPWNVIEPLGARIWPTAYVFLHADLTAEVPSSVSPVPLLPPDWDRSSPPVRPT